MGSWGNVLSGGLTYSHLYSEEITLFSNFGLDQRESRIKRSYKK
jgi:hypothetical protein